MSIETRVVRNAQTVEYGKFVELTDSRFPAVSVVRVQPRDTSNAFPENRGLPPRTEVEVYPKYAVLTYNAGGIGGSGPGGAYTMCETRSAGNPSFTPAQILIHNDSNSVVNVGLTLTSGMSCLIPIGKNTTANHIVSLNLAVSAVTNYAGTTITFFA